MKELTSSHDDLDKRLAIFFGLGAFIMSALVGLIRNYTLEGFLLQGVIVLTLATLVGWLFGIWLRFTLRSIEPVEQKPANVERKRADSLAEGSVVVPGTEEPTVISEEAAEPQKGTVVNFMLPELSPLDEPAPGTPGAAPTAGRNG